MNSEAEFWGGELIWTGRFLNLFFDLLLGSLLIQSGGGVAEKRAKIATSKKPTSNTNKKAPDVGVE